MAEPRATAKMYAEVFGSGNGPAVLEDILVAGFAYYRHQSGTPVDENACIFREGARSLAMGIKQMVADGKSGRPPAEATARTNVLPLPKEA